MYEDPSPVKNKIAMVPFNSIQIHFQKSVSLTSNFIETKDIIEVSLKREKKMSKGDLWDMIVSSDDTPCDDLLSLEVEKSHLAMI